MNLGKRGISQCISPLPVRAAAIAQNVYLNVWMSKCELQKFTSPFLHIEVREMALKHLSSTDLLLGLGLLGLGEKPQRLRVQSTWPHSCTPDLYQHASQYFSWHNTLISPTPHRYPSPSPHPWLSIPMVWPWSMTSGKTVWGLISIVVNSTINE